ncbi:MAG: HD domain-containing protein [Candidatus Eisenbacteria bacterium]
MNSPSELDGFITADPALAMLRAEALARDDGDLTHDTAHLLRVALSTLRLGGGAVEPREAVAAALLHDAVNLPKDSPERHCASERSAEWTRARLPGLGFSPEAIDRIADAVRDHSFSRGAVPKSALGCALQDADRLEALGAIGLLRCISSGIRMGGAWFDADDPWAERRPLDDAAFSIDHFATKLLKLPSTMRTDAGRAEAHQRAAFLWAFMVQLGHELGQAPPARG